MSEQLNQAQLTAPETIYLQHNDSGYMDEPFPTDHSGTSWCDEEVFNCDVRYVRADIAEGKQAELTARIAELEAKAADGTDWKAIAIVLGQRVNWAISHISERGTGLVLNTTTGKSRHWKEYMAEALRMIPGLTINDDILAAHCLPPGEKRKRFKQLAKRDEQAGMGLGA